MPGYTNTYSQSQKILTPNQNKNNHPRPNSMRNTLLFKEERCSRPLYSSHTPHPEHTNTTTGSICIYPGHKDNHPHTTQPTNESHHSVRAPCAAPDTQQRTNASDKNRLIAQSCDTHTHPCVHLLEASLPPGCVSTWKFSQKYGSAAPRTGTQQPNPTPSTGNYLTMRGQ